jgi:localization factor PodJL
MRSGGLWNLRGLRPEARAAASEAARRAGMSVGEWLNTVIQRTDGDGEDAWGSAAPEREPKEQWGPRSRYDQPEPGGYRNAPPRRHRNHESEERWRHNLRYDDLETEGYRNSRHEPPADDRYRFYCRDDEWERDRWRDAELRRRDDFEEEDEHEPQPPRPEQSRASREAPAYSAEPPLDLSGLEQQLRQITTKIESLRPNAELGIAINGLRAELAAIGRSLTEALPRRALESLEIEIKALTERIHHSRQSGVDAAALAGIERGLAEVREALGGLTPAESLIGFDEAIKALAKKVDGLASRDDPATLQQLETAISALRGVVSHVASNDTLTKVAEDVRALAAKVDSLVANAPALAALEVRVDKLVGAIKASTEAGHAVPRELEKLLSGLIERLERVQLTHADRSALAHLEDRIATLVKRLDMSDARLGLLEGVERSLADLPVYIEQLRSGAGAATAADVAPKPKPEPAPPEVTAARKPIDPSLPPDHPLEPGSAAGRSRQQPSAADQIVAAAAVVGSKSPVIPAAGGGKPDFIAAARRAAKAAAVASPSNNASELGTSAVASAKKLSERLRMVAVAVAVVAVVIGGYQIISRLPIDGGSNAPPQTQTEPPSILTEPLELPSEPAQLPRLQTEPTPEPIEPPHVQTELPPPSAATAPAENFPTNPGAALAETPSTPSHESPAPPTRAASEQQSLLSGNKTLPDAVAAAVVGQPLDITGSVPSAPAQHAPAAASLADKLPVTIGSPALRAAALAGDPSAAYQIAARFAEGRAVPANNEEAAYWFDVAAKKGLAAAQFRLGTLYEKGLGVRKSAATARDLYRAAAEKGHGKAMHNLAVLYAEGIDGKADFHMAAQWFRKAADRGIADSQYNLAVLYARGVGVEQNFSESYKWFFLAARNGDPDAAQKRDEVAAHLDEQALGAALLAAEQWTPVPQPRTSLR